MALTITGVSATLNFTTAMKEALGLASQQQTANNYQPLAVSFAVGTGADQCSKFVLFTGSVTAASPVSHDLSGGTLIDYCTGSAVTFTRIVGILIINLSTSGYLIAGGGSNPFVQFTSARNVRPSTSSNPGFVCEYAPDATGFVVTAATGDILKIDFSSGTGDYKMFLWGN